MNQVLTQSEVDALLNAVAEGSVDGAPGGAAGGGDAARAAAMPAARRFRRRRLAARKPKSLLTI